MSEAAERMRRIRAQRRSEGLCIRCGNKLIDEYSSCADCRTKYNEKKITAEREKRCVRSLRVWQITNQTLFNKLEYLNITISNFAKAVGVSTRTAERWLFERAIPTFENKLKINDFLGEEVYSLTNE